MPARPGPTARLYVLGRELRKLREDAGLNLEAAATRLERTVSSISKFENGKSALRPRDLRPILDAYGLKDPEQRDVLLGLAQHGRTPGWWTSYANILEQQYMDFITLESEARSARTFELTLIPGLLQTKEYARAVIAADVTDSANRDIEKLIDVRMARQTVLNRTDPAFSLWAILDEAVLRHHMGGREVMRDQLAHLIEVSQQTNITLQVIPLTEGAHPGINGSFTVMDLPEPSDISLVLLENLSSTLYMEREEEVRRYSLAFDRLRMVALGERQSLSLIEATAKEL